MAKVFFIDQRQCEIINYAEESTNLTNYTLLTRDSAYYTAIKKTLNKNAANEFKHAVALGQIFYRFSDISHYYIIHHISDSDIPNTAIPIMQYHEQTTLAQRVAENIYDKTKNKPLFITQLHANEFLYSIFDVTEQQPPEKALPLFVYSYSESTRINNDYKQTKYLMSLNDLYQNIKLLLTSATENPEWLLRQIQTISFAYVILTMLASPQVASGNLQVRKNDLQNNPDAISHMTDPIKQKDLQEELTENYIHTLNGIFPDDELENEIQNLRSSRFPKLTNPKIRENYIQFAIINDNLENFQHAIREGYDITALNTKGEHTIELAAKHNSISILEFMSSVGVDLNYFEINKSSLKNSLLITAIDNGHDELAANLVKWGIKINLPDKHKKTLLHHLAALPYHKTNTHRINTLIKLGADINLRDFHGQSPVFIAGHNNNTKVMKIFLDHRCKSTLGEYPIIRNLLTRCMEESSLETVEFLLQQGLDPYAHIDNFVSSESNARGHVPVFVAILRGDIEFMKLLVKYNVNFNKYPEHAENLMLTAWNTGDVEIPFLLAKHNVSINKIKALAKRTGNAENAQNIREFIGLVKAWKIYKDTYLQNQKQASEFFKTHDYINPDELSVSEFLLKYSKHPEFLKKYDEYKKSQTESANTTSGFFSTVINSIYNNVFIIFKVHAYLYSLIGMLLLTLYHWKNFRQKHYAAKLKHEDSPEKEKKKSNEARQLIKTLNQELEKAPDSDLPEATSTRKHKISSIDDNKKTIDNLLSKNTNKIYELLQACSYEQENIIKQAYLRNRANIYSKHKKMEIEKGLRKYQVLYNENVTKLTAISKSLNASLTSKFIDCKGLELLNHCQTELKLLLNALEVGLKNDDETACDKHANIIESYKRFRIEICNDIKLADNLIEENEHLVKTLHKLSAELPTNKIINSEKPSLTINLPLEILEEPIIEIKPKQVSISNNTNTLYSIKSTPNKQKKITKPSTKTHSIITSTACNLDTPEIILNDNRVLYINELFLSIENIINNHNVDDTYKNDAALYLLMKSSHLIAQLCSRYKTIIMPFKDRMYHLRNNIVHYPEQCLLSTNIISFLTEYFHIFKQPLANLVLEGCHKEIIDTESLYKLSEFMLTDNRNLDSNHFTLNDCLIEIKYLCKKAALHYELGCELQINMKYELAGPLHYAMHAIILQMREKFRTLRDLNYYCFNDIAQSLPDIISFGNIIAHDYLDEKEHKSSRKLEGREYYIQQDFSALTILDLMKKIKINLENIYIICDDFLSMNSHNIISKGI